MPSILRMRFERSIVIILMLNLSACMKGPAVDLAPHYRPAQFVVPDSWHGASPFVEAKPSDGELRGDWWKVYNDPVLNQLEAQAMAANPNLQAAAERFVQARDMMMKVRSRLIPQIGLNFGGSKDKQSVDSLFRAPDSPIYDISIAGSGMASWEPDFWSAIRNTARVEIYRAEQRAAEYGLARLILQAEIARDYFTLRGYDLQAMVYKESVEAYKTTLDVVQHRFIGEIAPLIDVTRTQYLLFYTEAKLLDIQALRQVTEHALAKLVNRVPAGFRIEPVNELSVVNFKLPRALPATLLERRPDIAAMERKMAQANRTIGIARAAFFPNVVFSAGGGYENSGFDLIKLANSFWSYGSTVSLPAFMGGYRRAQLQQSWSIYREMEDKYRATVLDAFREVENNLSRTKLFYDELERQTAAVAAATETQNLTWRLYKGGLASSLEVLYAQISRLKARIDAIDVKVRLLTATVELTRSLGGGWNRKQLPADEQIQPFDVIQYTELGKPKPAGGIDVPAGNNALHNDLTKSVDP